MTLNRRSFLASLAALPFVGRLFPQPTSFVAIADVSEIVPYTAADIARVFGVPAHLFHGTYDSADFGRGVVVDLPPPPGVTRFSPTDPKRWPL